MMKRHWKRVVCAATAALCLAGTAVPTFAETVDFDVTYPGDIISPRAVKADGEQRFYVTATYFNLYNGLYCTSHLLQDPGLDSYQAVITPDAPSSSAEYRYFAPAGIPYFMQVDSALNGLRVQGRYTP
mgnify:FL=1